jgi:hypothetical protein
MTYWASIEQASLERDCDRSPRELQVREKTESGREANKSLLLVSSEVCESVLLFLTLRGLCPVAAEALPFVWVTSCTPDLCSLFVRSFSSIPVIRAMVNYMDGERSWNKEDELKKEKHKQRKTVVLWYRLVGPESRLHAVTHTVSRGLIRDHSMVCGSCRRSNRGSACVLRVDR